MLTDVVYIRPLYLFMAIVQELHFNQVHIALILSYLDLLIFTLRTMLVVKQDIKNIGTGNLIKWDIEILIK